MNELETALELLRIPKAGITLLAVSKTLFLMVVRGKVEVKL